MRAKDSGKSTFKFYSETVKLLIKNIIDRKIKSDTEVIYLIFKNKTVDVFEIFKYYVKPMIF